MSLSLVTVLSVRQVFTALMHPQTPYNVRWVTIVLKKLDLIGCLARQAHLAITKDSLLLMSVFRAQEVLTVPVLQVLHLLDLVRLAIFVPLDLILPRLMDSVM